MARQGAVALACVLFVVGCVESATQDAPEELAALELPADWVVRSLPNGDDHDHFDRAQHLGLSTPNFQVVGWDPLVTDHHGMNPSGYFCGDLERGDDRTLAVVHSFSSDVAFVLVDVTDPAKPVKLGELVMERTQVWDVAMTPDQRHVLLATSPLGMQDEESGRSPALPAAPRAWFRDACTGETHVLAGPEAALPYHSGVVLVDIRDVAAPQVADFRPLPILGGHSVVAQDVGGETVVLVTVSNTLYANYYVFMGLLETPLGARLQTHSVYQTDMESLGSTGLLRANHDGSMQVHPATQQRLAYLADGHWGVTILDIEEPRTPRVLARWDDAADIANPDPQHFAHSILPLDELWDGRHYTFVSEECAGRPADTPSCLVYALDTTDPAAPELVGAWTLPHDMGSWNYPGFSPHYMAVIDRTLFVAHWHAGLWALDVSTPEKMRTMPILGAFVPDQDVETVTPSFLFRGYNMVPVVADVLVSGNELIVFDGTSGIYVLRFDATRPAPSPEPWPLNVP